MSKRLERKLERKQNKDIDVCVFMQLQKCSPKEAEYPSDCIDGGYIFCKKYTQLYQEYIGGKV